MKLSTSRRLYIVVGVAKPRLHSLNSAPPSSSPCLDIDGAACLLASPARECHYRAVALVSNREHDALLHNPAPSQPPSMLARDDDDDLDVMLQCVYVSLFVLCCCSSQSSDCRLCSSAWTWMRKAS